MSKKRPSRKPKPEPNAVIDVELHFGSYVVQHIAVSDDRPISQWVDREDVLRAARLVEHLLPLQEALSVSHLQWYDIHGLKFSVTPTNRTGRGLPYLSAQIRNCSAETALRLMAAQRVHIMLSLVETPIRPALDRSPNDPTPAPGTVRDPYAHGHGAAGDVRNRAEEVAAVNAARKAAGLALLKTGIEGAA